MKKILIIFKILSKFTEDFFILGGLFLIIRTTYRINILLGNYLLGVVLLILGFLISKRTPGRR